MNMKIKLFILFIAILSLIPIISFADCSKTGTTVVFINGIFSNEISAEADRSKLEYFYNRYGENKNVKFVTGFNPSHVAGVDDLANSIIQAYRGGYTDFDLTTILRQLHIDLKTQKIVLVGHSQGSFYTNAAYDYLINNGVDRSAIAVYNIGTPADRVAGNGKYLTSSTDEIINATVRGLANAGFANKPLPANIDIKIPNNSGVNYDKGHSFSKVYLGLAPDRIIGDIDQTINSLVANTDKEECFVQPEAGILYNVWDGGYTIIDNMGKVGKYAGTGNTPQVDAVISYLFQGIYNLGKGIGNTFANLFNNSGFFGASLASLPEQEISSDSTFNPDPIDNTIFNWPDLLDYNGIGGPDENYIAEQSMQDLLDDIQEKIDVINQQVQSLVAQREQDNQQKLEEGDKITDEDNNNDDNDNNNNDNSGKLGNGGNYVTYPQILISEVQTLPIDKRFIELYNPNNKNIDLTGWYLQRKDKNDTSWSSLVSSTNFSGKMIPANGYFLIAREIPSIDIITNITLTNDNSIALKNPNGEISDKLGFGSAMDPEALSTENPTTGKSIGRKVISLEGSLTEQETDNNLNDFEANNPTPRAQNEKTTIFDTIAPVITLNGDLEITITVGDGYVDARATALDDIDGDITANIVIVNPVDVNTVG
ncbi:MAG: lamin tail domain-containing protein, partial [Candidatus Staskawiczbacteria bacterium]